MKAILPILAALPVSFVASILHRTLVDHPNVQFNVTLGAGALGASIIYTVSAWLRKDPK